MYVELFIGRDNADCVRAHERPSTFMTTIKDESHNYYLLLQYIKLNNENYAHRGCAYAILCT